MPNAARTARPGLAALTALAALLLLAAPALAGRQHVLVGLDGKTVFAPGGDVNGPEGADAVAVLDASDPANPVIAHVIPLPNSVYGPPTNLAVTPDGRLGLVASSVVMEREGEAFVARPDDRLFVLDLEARPPRVIATLRTGRQPSGMAINAAGTLALVANRAGRSVSVIAIDGASARVAGEVALGEEAAAVGFAPDGRRAYVALNKAARVAVLAVDGLSITRDPALDLPVGAGAYAAEVTPDGALLLTADVGVAPSDGHADTVSVARLDGSRPRVVDRVAVGDTPETLVIAPGGAHAAVVVVGGSAAPHAAWSYAPRGSVVLLSLGGGRVRAVDEAPVGALPECAAFAPDGRHLYVGNYADKDLWVLRVDGDKLVDTGRRLALPGQPASMRGAAAGPR